jgi:hypothetical protein
MAMGRTLTSSDGDMKDVYFYHEFREKSFFPESRTGLRSRINRQAAQKKPASRLALQVRREKLSMSYDRAK